MSRKKGLNQKPMALRLDNENIEPLKIYARFTGKSINRAINDCIKNYTFRYIALNEIRIPGL